ncbi:DUF2191 domain-containing protein [Acidobacteria bacterium AH-259-A15]|nr:DUF2191 domain-containing protein [Acidobacteria bacterium AH-259-A15]
MRTTLTIDDKLAEALKELAYTTNKSFKDVVNETLQAGLTTKSRPPRTKPYRVKPVSLGGAQAGVNLDKALQLADAIEDEEIARKIRMRK